MLLAAFCLSALKPTAWHDVDTTKLLAVVLVGNSQLLATMCTTGSQNATAVLCGHSLAEAVLVDATAIVRLECSFHFIYCVLNYYIFNSIRAKASVWAAKLLIIFETTKN
jgi:hypothetical protein